MSEEGDDAGGADDLEFAAYEVGRGRPPVASRFQPGQSGNPTGRPRGTKKAAVREAAMPYEYVLGRMVTIRENGVEKEVTADEALLRVVAERGIREPTATGRAALRAIERLDDYKHGFDHDGPFKRVVIVTSCEQGQVDRAIRYLKIATLIDQFDRTKARLLLEPWIVQAALDRLGGRELTPAQQRRVLDVTRFPKKVRWPKWWSIESKR